MIECSVMLLVPVKMLLLSVPAAVNNVPWAVEAVNWDRKLDRSSSSLVTHGGSSRFGGWLPFLLEPSTCLARLPDDPPPGSALLSDPVLELGPRWSCDGLWRTDERVLEDLADDNESARVRWAGLCAGL